MPKVEITAKLPERLIADLESEGAKVLKECELPVIILVDSKKATELFMAFLAGDVEVDPALLPTFGGVMAPYQSPAVQLEVHSMLPALPLVPCLFHCCRHLRFPHWVAISTTMRKLRSKWCNKRLRTRLLILHPTFLC